MLKTRNVCVVARPGNDPILDLLTNPDPTTDDFKAIVSYMEPIQAEDIMICCEILTRLEKYSRELLAWPYQILANYQFHSQARQFDLDLAVLVGNRAANLLKELYSWNIKGLKDKAYKLSMLSSDANMVLTMLILRIGEEYDDLELDLQLAISRSTLVKIDHELVGLLSKFPSAAVDGQDGPPLVEKYRAFVKQLLSELKTTPFETVQQEMFQVVHDLQQMFSRFQTHHHSQNVPHHQIPFEEAPPSPTLFEETRSQSHKYSPTESSYACSSVTKANIREDLPLIMKAFDGKKRGSTWNLSDRQLAQFQKHSRHLENKRHVNRTENHFEEKCVPPQSKNEPSKPLSNPQTLQVATIDGKVMVATDKGYQDMQDWLRMQSTMSSRVSRTQVQSEYQAQSQFESTQPPPKTIKQAIPPPPKYKPFPLNVAWPFAPNQKESPPAGPFLSTQTSEKSIKPTATFSKPTSFQDNYTNMMGFSL